jgi:radical SAM superfamily enzyme YgiQ (UPF0313 family)
MRVLLAQPPLTTAGEVAPPLGLCTLASWLRVRGHDVRILDLDLELRFRREPVGYATIFGESMRDFAPQAVGITSMYSNSLQAEHLVRVAKHMNPAAMTVAGGSHFGALCSRALARIPELDFAIEGEGEAAFAALVEGVPLTGIPRLHYRVNGTVTQNPSEPVMDLSRLPPMWCTLGDTIALERYPQTIQPATRRRIAYVEAGRGCPFRCSFCATAPFWEHRFRVKPVQRLIDEVSYLHNELGYDSFILVHDLLTVSPAFISEFCDAMRDSRLPVEWMANSRTDSRLEGLLAKMKAAGCWKLFHGVESAAPRVQSAIRKNLSNRQVYRCIEDLNAHGIGATTSFVIGFPSESQAELSSTIAMAARLKLMGVETVQFHRLRRFPPAPLSRGPGDATFDLESLRIEYPFLDVPEEDIQAIRADPEFFSGYWLPETPAGTAADLAQIEMFFHHAVALVPLTVAAVAAVAAGEVVASFYRAVSQSGPIRRDRLDWEAGNLWGNWWELSPLLNLWIDEAVPTGGWQNTLMHGLQHYEAERIAFVTGRPTTNAIVSTPSWVAFDAGVRLSAVLNCLRNGTELSADLLHDTIVVLVRRRDEQFAAYLVDPTLRHHVIAGDPDLLKALH